MARSILLLAFAAFAICSTARHAKSPTVTLDSGVYIGTTTQLETATPVVNKFLGLPFAATPKRFERPEPVQHSRQRQQATTLPPVCYQQYNYPEAARTLEIAVFNNPAPEESDDCLYLNVWAPVDSFHEPQKGKGKAVLFWIFGGGFQFGGGAIPQYDGTSFAANQDVIVVTHNYRTNVFGFPGDSPDVPDSAKNLGFYDQRAALAWVQQNIHKFGGDPDKVTIFGESAGAASVDLLILTETENPPFRAGILESGSASLGSRALSLTGGADTSTPPIQQLAAALNCTNATTLSAFECVRQAPATQIKPIIEQKAIGFPVLATNDSTVPSENPLDLRRSRQIANVPILLGSNAQEFQIFLWFAVGGNTASVNFTSYVSTLVPVPSLVDALRQAYPASQYASDFDAVAALVTDVAFNCPAALVANASATAGYQTWRYLYNATFPNTTPFPGAGAYHASEIPQLFGLYPPHDGVSLPGPTEEELALSRRMQTAWADFAKNPETGPGWNSYAAAGPQTFGVFGGNDSTGGTNILRDEPVAQNDARCALFNGVIGAGSKRKRSMYPSWRRRASAGST